MIIVMFHVELGLYGNSVRHVHACLSLILSIHDETISSECIYVKMCRQMDKGRTFNL